MALAMSDFAVDGEWWLAGTDRSRSGHLDFTVADGAKLTVVGLIPDDSDFIPEGSVILGKTVDGRKVTLLGCIETQREMVDEPDAINASHVFASVLLMNEHFLTEDAARFKVVLISYTDLEYWFGRRGLTREEWHRISYNEPEPITAAFEEYRVSIESHLAGVSGDWHHSFRESAGIRMESSEPLPLRTWQRDVIPILHSFVVLGVGRAVYSTLFRAYPTADPLREVEVLYGVRHMPVKQKAPVDELLCKGDDFAADASDVLGAWFKSAVRLQPVYDLYTGLFYKQGNYPLNRDFEFLGFVQALEAYLSRMGPGYNLNEADFAKVAEALVAALPSTLADEVRRAYTVNIQKNLNRRSLRSRINELVKGAEEIVRPIVPVSGDERRAFVDRVVSTRNYLTHYSEDLETVAVRDWRRLHLLTLQVRLLLEVCLLRAAGFGDVRIRALIRRTRRYRLLYDYLDA